mmetsp:Transcript_8584/g.32285  ORF Transcript_8584/g.32285 Transcript_8584/m.32285 type:complete len:214 (+) Transcript_8584:737-1378(+)
MFSFVAFPKPLGAEVLIGGNEEFPARLGSAPGEGSAAPKACPNGFAPNSDVVGFSSVDLLGAPNPPRDHEVTVLFPNAKGFSGEVFAAPKLKSGAFFGSMVNSGSTRLLDAGVSSSSSDPFPDGCATFAAASKAPAKTGCLLRPVPRPLLPKLPEKLEALPHPVDPKLRVPFPNVRDSGLACSSLAADVEAPSSTGRPSKSSRCTRGIFSASL